MIIYEFCELHPVMAFLAILAIAAISFFFIYCASYTICFTARHMTLRKIGYPPPHCDVDGDFQKTSKEKL